MDERLCLEGDAFWMETIAERDTALAEVERLREMICYALDGPDADLPEPLGGRAVGIVKKILRDALGEGETA